MKNKIGQYAVYYGYGRQEELSFNDLIIVEPKAQDKASLSVLKQHGAQVLAYVSVMEITKAQMGEFLLEDRDLIITDEKSPETNDYGNYKVDLRTEKWHRYLMDLIIRLCANEKYDGVFLDTIGNLESEQVLLAYHYELHKAYRLLLKEIRANFPDIIIIQNNGLDTVFHHARDLINGICWENPPIGAVQSILWVKMITRRLIQQIKSNPEFLVMLLEDQNRYPLRTKKYAQKNNWLYYRANHDYL